jgi:hypothetical protein
LSVCVQALLSVHSVPFGAKGFEQVPATGSQVPAVWHASEAVHVLGFAPVQEPPWHVSLWVQAFPSLQAVPFVAAGFEQEPLVGSHVPTTWQESEAGHVFGFAPMHVPTWQLSVCVHALPSLHAVPSASGGFEQTPVPGSQLPAV